MTTDPGKTHSYEDDCQPPHERPNAGRLGRAELTNALHAAEQRAKNAELAHRLQAEDNAGLRHTITVLQRTAELQLALVTATADVVAVARHVENSNSQIPGGTELSYISTWLIEELGAALAALDQASPREPA